MKTRTTDCKASEDFFLRFLEDGKVLAEFGTTKEVRHKYNRLREEWRTGLSLEKLRARIQKIIEG